MSDDFDRTYAIIEEYLTVQDYLNDQPAYVYMYLPEGEES